MYRNLLRFWKFLGDFPRVYLGIVLAIEMCASVFICRKERYEVGLSQFLLGVQEILASRRIHSTFLPIGYPALIGWTEVAAYPHGAKATMASLFGVQILMLLLLVYLIRASLLQSTSARLATTAAAIVGLQPQFLAEVRFLNDVNLTLITLLFIFIALSKFDEAPNGRNAFLAGAALACGVLVRPNLVLLSVLLMRSVYGLRRSNACKLLVSAGSAAILIYCGATSIVHGRPFYPHNGPYNLYAGFNAHTEAALRTDFNAENSIFLAMADQGVHTRIDWQQQADLPGIDDARDEKYIPFYVSQTRAYIVATQVALCGFVLSNL